MFEEDIAVDAWQALCNTPFEDEPLRRSWPSATGGRGHRTDDPRFEMVVDAIVRYGARGPIPPTRRRTAKQIREAFEQAEQHAVELARLIRQNAVLQHPLKILLTPEERQVVDFLLLRTTNANRTREDAGWALDEAVSKSPEYLATILERFARAARTRPLPRPIAGRPENPELDARIFATGVCLHLDGHYGGPLHDIVARLTQARFGLAKPPPVDKWWQRKGDITLG